MHHVSLTNETMASSLDERLLCDAVRHVLQTESIDEAQVGIAVVDDATIHELNVRYLKHDYPTDVLSFPLSADDEPLDGEVVVSLDTARREAEHFGWSTDDELLLYVIHGTLHLTGHDDTTPALAAVMREKESAALKHFGRTARHEPISRESVLKNEVS